MICAYSPINIQSHMSLANNTKIFKQVMNSLHGQNYFNSNLPYTEFPQLSKGGSLMCN